MVWRDLAECWDNSTAADHDILMHPKRTLQPRDDESNLTHQGAAQVKIDELFVICSAGL